MQHMDLLVLLKFSPINFSPGNTFRPNWRFFHFFSLLAFSVQGGMQSHSCLFWGFHQVSTLLPYEVGISSLAATSIC